MNLVTIGDVILPTKVALTDEEHEVGLKNIKAEPPVMTFVFAKPEVRYFWMKDTYVPLAIIFCGGGTVVNVAQGVPMSENLIGLPVQSDLVIEMPRGSVEQLGIVAGQRVEIQLDSVAMAKRLKTRMPHLG